MHTHMLRLRLARNAAASSVSESQSKCAEGGGRWQAGWLAGWRMTTKNIGTTFSIAPPQKHPHMSFDTHTENHWFLCKRCARSILKWIPHWGRETYRLQFGKHFDFSWFVVCVCVCVVSGARRGNVSDANASLILLATAATLQSRRIM